MKTIRMIFFTALSWSTSSYALPAKESHRIYFCQNDTLQAYISRKEDGQNLILLEDISNHRAPVQVMKEAVSELSNKFYTIYTSDEIILKMTKNPSGFMDGTLILTNGQSPSKDELKCQLVYNI